MKSNVVFEKLNQYSQCSGSCIHNLYTMKHREKKRVWFFPSWLQCFSCTVSFHLSVVSYVEGQGEGGGVKLSRHRTGRLISIKNVSKWRESTEVSNNSNHQPRCIYF